MLLLALTAGGLVIWYLVRKYRRDPFKKVRARVPTVFAPSGVGPGCEFRFAKDSESAIRIRWHDPPGPKSICMIMRDVQVAGASQPSAKANILSFIAGTERSLVLARDPQNKFDKNAIKVVGNWKNVNGTATSGQLGWVPSETAKEAIEEAGSAYVQFYATLRTIFLPSAGKSAGLRFDMWA